MVTRRWKTWTYSEECFLLFCTLTFCKGYAFVVFVYMMIAIKRIRCGSASSAAWASLSGVSYPCNGCEPEHERCTSLLTEAKLRSNPLSPEICNSLRWPHSRHVSKAHTLSSEQCGSYLSRVLVGVHLERKSFAALLAVLQPPCLISELYWPVAYLIHQDITLYWRR